MYTYIQIVANYASPAFAAMRSSFNWLAFLYSFQIFLVTLILCVGSDCVQGQSAFHPDLTVQDESVNWKLLDFEERGRRIKSVRVVLDRIKHTSPPDSYLLRDESFVANTSDPRILSLMEAFLNKAPREHFGSPQLSHPIPLSDISTTIGHIVITTTTDEFRIFVNDHGYVLESRIPQWDRLFQSWGVTKVIDAILFDRTSAHLPKRLHDHFKDTESEEVLFDRISNTHPSQATSKRPETLRPIAHDYTKERLGEITRFIVAPDGTEVWCVVEYLREPWREAFVFHTRESDWERIPKPVDSGRFLDAAFSSDGKKVWLSYVSDDGRYVTKERTPGVRDWRDCPWKLPNLMRPERIYVSPKSDELWIASDSLLRIRLDDALISQYVDNPLHALDDVMHHKMHGRRVESLLFTHNSESVVCTTNESLSIIDLSSGDIKDFLHKGNYRAQPLFAPNDQTVACIINNSELWAFSIKKMEWTYKLSHGLICRSVAIPPDEKYIWAYWPKLCFYSFATKEWKTLPGQGWLSDEEHPLLQVTKDGMTMLCGHDRGIALFAVDGSSCEVLMPDITAESCVVYSALPIPNSTEYVCSISFPGSNGLYRLDVKNHRLRKIKSLNHPSKTIALAPDGYVWAALPSGIVCVKTTSGEERRLPLLPQTAGGAESQFGVQKTQDVNENISDPPGTTGEK